MIRILQFLFVSYQSCCCATVVSIGNIHRWYLSDNLRNTTNRFRITNHPEGMSKTIQIRHKVIFRFTCHHIRDDSIQVLAMRVSKEHRFHIGIVYAHMLHAVLFFVAACQFVLHDATFHIVFHPSCQHQSILCAPIHCLGIDIIAVLSILHQPPFLTEQVKLLTSHSIHTLIMLICTVFKIDFGLDDMI